MPKNSYRESLLRDLLDPEEAASYINAAIEDGDSEMLLLALRDVAEAHKMSKVAKGAGIAREAIYRSLSEKGNPRLTTLLNLFGTLGLSIAVRPHSRRIGSKAPRKDGRKKGRNQKT